MERHEEKERRSYEKLGTLGARLLEPYRDRLRHPSPLKAEDIFPHLRREPTLEEQETWLEQFFGRLGISKVNGSEETH